MNHNILERIGNTPLVELQKIPQQEGIRCKVLVKCEFFNAGGSVKDRIAKEMVLQAEKDGRLKPNCTLIEPTSGNTGIGIALCAAVKGYKCIITLPEKMSNEKVSVLKALGAEIIRTPTEAAWDSPESHISVARRLNEKIKDSVILDQYTNPANPGAHYKYTATEIWEQSGQKVDMFVAGAGTGGTISGCATKLKELNKDIVIVGVDPEGSILAEPKELNQKECAYQVEGIGYDFIPGVLNLKLVDKWYKSNDKESFVYARKMIREEGLLCGGSCGSALANAFKAIRDYGYDKDPSKTVVVLLPDSVRNYITKFLSDDWMKSYGFMSSEPQVKSPIVEEINALAGYTVKDLKLLNPITVELKTPCKTAIEIMKKNAFDQLPVVAADKKIKGLITLGNILSKLASGKITTEASVEDVMFKFDKSKQYVQFGTNTTLSELSKFFDKHSAAIITENEQIVGVTTKIDLISWMVNK